ncbi:metallophosphoesterase family protein [Helicobacter sp. T3_23-1056]
MKNNKKRQKSSKIYIFGDTHGIIETQKVASLQDLYTSNDYVVICGDFGVIWNDKPNEAELNIQAILNDLPCKVLFVDGNHENFNRINALPRIKMFGSEVGRYTCNVFHLRRGHIYRINDRNFFVQGGALSIDKEWRIPNVTYWKQEDITQGEVEFTISNIENFTGNIDYVLSHTIPTTALNELGKQISIRHKIHDTNSIKLEWIYQTLQKRDFDIKAWFFGHWHDDVDMKVAYNNKNMPFFCSYYTARMLENDDIKTIDFTKRVRIDMYNRKMVLRKDFEKIAVGITNAL